MSRIMTSQFVLDSIEYKRSIAILINQKNHRDNIDYVQKKYIEQILVKCDHASTFSSLDDLQK